MNRVKKIPIFLVAAVLMLSARIDIFAAEIPGVLETTVFVEQIFTVSAASLSIDFGSVDPEPDTVTDMKVLKFYCQTNNNNLWKVSIELTSPLSSEMLFTIPNENFLWRGESTGAGRWPNGNEGHLDTTPITFYSSGNEEFVTPAPIEFTFQFEVNIPENQAAGTYSTTMVLTMKDISTSQEVETPPINVSVTVNPRLFITANPSSLDFGAIDPGQTTEAKRLAIACSANNNNPWSVSIHATSELTSETYTIPNENFQWSIVQTGGGLTGHGGAMITTPYTFYRCSIDEYITSPSLIIYLDFKIKVPPKQPIGQYITTLVLTLTEELGI